MLFIIAIGVCIIASYVFYRYQKIQNSLKQKNARLENSKYRCAVIKTSHFACQAAKKIESQPILIDVAPVLPLKQCDISKCDCRYIRHNDRRQENRRTPYPTMANAINLIKEKRSFVDRRKQPQAT